MKRLLPILFLPLLAHAETFAAVDEVALRALSLVGTSYRPGGIDPREGFDCSGFVNHVYREGLGIDLPRDSGSLSRIGEPVDRSELVAGDLVFFTIDRHRVSHVGIYVGENRFIHASSSRSGAVMLSSLNEPYWAKRYHAARRIATDTAGLHAAMDPIPPRLAVLESAVE